MKLGNSLNKLIPTQHPKMTIKAIWINLGQNVPLKAFKEIGKQIDFSKKQKIDDDDSDNWDYDDKENEDIKNEIKE